MGNRKLWVMILAGIMAFFLLFGLVGGVLPQLVSATSSLSELEQQLKDLKNEKAELDGQIEELEGQLSENLEDMKDMEEEGSKYVMNGLNRLGHFLNGH